MWLVLVPSPSRRGAGLAIAIALLLSLPLEGCTTTDPYTGEQRIDAGSTALAVGALAAVGAVAWAASRDDDDDDDDWDDRWDRYYSPGSGVRCYRAQRACYDRNGFDAYWTRREFGRRGR
jgi:hypothetical protein